jgi:hypothetical protein
MKPSLKQTHFMALARRGNKNPTEIPVHTVVESAISGRKFGATGR